MPPRATPLDPGERRAALIDATLPLMCERGTDITTKEIAAAAGVAEGTIFRAFASKQILFDACIDAALDPAPVAAEIAAIDPALPLEDRLRAVVAIWQRHITAVSGLMRAIHHPPGRGRAQGRTAKHRPADGGVIAQAVAEVLAPDTDRFRLPVEDVISTLRAVAFGTALPFVADARVGDPDTLVDIVMHGVCTC